jgi:hypothetical protein
MKSIAPLLLILLLSAFAYSQAKTADENKRKERTVITITVATMQRWSGGIVGHQGCYYNIEVNTAPNGKGAQPDTIWIGAKCFPLKMYESKYPVQETDNCRLVKGKDKWTYSFRINSDLSTGSPVPIDTLAAKKKEMIPNAPDYKGKAAISYTYRHKKHLEAIVAFKQLEAINYP